jgi:hypothetical protein
MKGFIMFASRTWQNAKARLYGTMITGCEMILAWLLERLSKEPWVIYLVPKYNEQAMDSAIEYVFEHTEPDSSKAEQDLHLN